MKNYLLAVLALAIFACKNETNPNADTAATAIPKLTKANYKQTQGDSIKGTAVFDIDYSVVTEGSKALKDSVQIWTENNIRDISVMDDTLPTHHFSIEESSVRFFKSWQEELKQEYAAEMPRNYEVQSIDTALCITNKILTMRSNLYYYFAGAHPNYSSALANFDVATGRQLANGEIIKNENAILPQIEKAYRILKKEAFDAGFVFEGGKIAFPAQFAITEKGILFHYDVYEIAAYVVGDADIFLTWEQLGTAAVNPFLTTTK